jgi:uroporphyrin-III C-methyltransferase
MIALRTVMSGLPEFLPGHCWLAGAGPGHPRHLTAEVIAALGEADAVVHDALIEPSVLAIAGRAELHFAGKRGGRSSTRQDDITDLLIALARRRLRVLRLKGGDPYLFGRGGEEVYALAAAGIPFRVLPGVSSVFGALAAADIPATMRCLNKALILATGHAAGSDDDLDWAALARTGQPLVIFMGLANLERIAGLLRQGGMAAATPAAVIMAATTAEERIVVATLETIAQQARQAGLGAPALIVVGSIVTMRAELESLARMARTG